MDSPASIFGSSVTGVYEMEMSLAYASPFYGRTKSGPPQRRDDYVLLKLVESVGVQKRLLLLDAPHGLLIIVAASVPPW